METLKRLMEVKKINQEQTSEILGVTQSHISRLLKGKEKASKALELSIERLLEAAEGRGEDSRTKRLVELFESLPEESKKDILRCAEKEKLLCGGCIDRDAA
ncbi:MAG: helix-turn-helix domain-containing protein [Desulfobacter sp.]